MHVVRTIRATTAAKLVRVSHAQAAKVDNRPDIPIIATAAGHPATTKSGKRLGNHAITALLKAVVRQMTAITSAPHLTDTAPAGNGLLPTDIVPMGTAKLR